MKKVLILGGKPIGSCEMTEAVNNMGYYSIVADYLSVDRSAMMREVKNLKEDGIIDTKGRKITLYN